MDKPNRSRMIRDKTSQAQGFDRFSRSSVSLDGGALIAEYPSGAVYRIPLEYLLTWYTEPHHIEPRTNPPSTVNIERSRRFSDNHLIRVSLSDGRKYDVAWDVVLMSCEPLYEHYGGFTDYSRSLVSQWLPKGPFRLK